MHDPFAVNVFPNAMPGPGQQLPGGEPDALVPVQQSMLYIVNEAFEIDVLRISSLTTLVAKVSSVCVLTVATGRFHT